MYYVRECMSHANWRTIFPILRGKRVKSPWESTGRIELKRRERDVSSPLDRKKSQRLDAARLMWNLRKGRTWWNFFFSLKSREGTKGEREKTRRYLAFSLIRLAYLYRSLRWKGLRERERETHTHTENEKEKKEKECVIVGGCRGMVLWRGGMNERIENRVTWRGRWRRRCERGRDGDDR